MKFHDDKMTGVLQENILTLLCYDDNLAKTLRYVITAQMFEQAMFREVATHALDFVDQFDCAIKEHLPDSLEHILQGDDKRKAGAYEKLLHNLYVAKDTVNGDYVLSQLQKFVRQQNLKTAIVKAVEALEDGDTDRAENVIEESRTRSMFSFDRGLMFNDPSEATAFLDETEAPFLTGIEELDKRGIGPARKELFLVMAPAGMGKTWFMIQLGKFALLQRLCVVHITLEMSAKKMAQRYVQSLFSVSKRESRVQIPRFRKSATGEMEDVFYEEIERLTLTDPQAKKKISERVRKDMAKRPPLIIKEFPTGSLTLDQIDAYLDGLHRFHKITPDMVILDYPDLMELKGNDLRIAVGNVVKGFRGLCIRRNLAGVAASQSNRESARSNLVDETHASEDYSKIATADNVFTYTQTRAERKLGLARIYAAKVRNDEAKWIALLTQNYAIGQFALDSAYMADSDYWGFLSGARKDDDDEDD